MFRRAAYTRLAFAVVAPMCAAIVFTPRAASQRQAGRQRVSIAGREAVAGEVLVRFAAAAREGDRAILEQQVDSESSEAIAHDLRRIRSRSPPRGRARPSSSPLA